MHSHSHILRFLIKELSIRFCCLWHVIAGVTIAGPLLEMSEMFSKIRPCFDF